MSRPQAVSSLQPSVVASPAELVVAFLGCAASPASRTAALGNLNPQKWPQLLQWMDDAGLSFYFLQKLTDTGSRRVVPGWVVKRLEENFAANQRRVGEMSRRFDVLNRQFENAGVLYAVLKGFSLVPQFCPSAALRYQADLDYLIAEDSLTAAQQILRRAGYAEKPSRSRLESIFVPPGSEQPSRGVQQYGPQAPYAVELHLDLWDGDLHQLHSIPRLFKAEHTVPHPWNGLVFPVLADEDAFLVQILHACHHLFTQWIRLSSLLEIAYFLNRRAADTPLWERVEQRVGDHPMLQEFVVVVTELANALFAAELPPLVRTWGAHIQPQTRVWIQKYARDWALCDLPVHQFHFLPRTKLIRFLRQQYHDDAPGQTATTDPAPSSRLARMASSIRRNPSLVLDRAWWKRQLLVRRSLFHALGTLRYWCEIPRWMWLNRARMRSAPHQL